VDQPTDERRPSFGIDVVDLTNPRTRGRHVDRRFMERIFGAAERARVSASTDPERAVWRHWAAKEAAFKAIGIHLHPSASPPFEHAAFEVLDLGSDRGTLRWESREFELRLDEDPGGGWVSAVAGLDGLDSDIEWTAADIEETSVRLGAPGRDALDALLGPRERKAARGFAHGIVRLAARTEVAYRLGRPAAQPEIVNAPGPAGRTPPLVRLDGSPFPGARVSLSHDGPFVAWASWTVSGRTDGS